MTESSYWNYRVIACAGPEKPYLMIHEVYYSQEGEPRAWAVEPATVGGDTKEELQCVLIKMHAALDKPFLTMKYSKLVEWVP